MVSNHAKTIQYLGVLRAGGIQCNHFQVFGFMALLSRVQVKSSVFRLDYGHLLVTLYKYTTQPLL